MKFLHVTANEMNYIAAIHEGITGIHTIIQITSQIILQLLIAEVFYAEQLTKRTLLLMSTFPPWRHLLVSNQISHTSQQASGSTAQTKVPRPIPKKHSPRVEEPAPDPTSTSSHPDRRLQRKAFEADGKSIEDAKSKDSRQNEAGVPSSYPPSTTEPLSEKPSITVCQSTGIRIRSSHLRQTGEKQLKLPHKHLQLKADSKVTGPHRSVSHEEPDRPIKGTPPNLPPSDKKSTNSKSKRRSNTESSKTASKPKVQSLPVKSRNRQKKRKLGRSKESGLTEASDLLEENAEGSFRVTAAGQHGCMKNASTGSDSLESSFTVVNIDQANFKDQVKTTDTRCVGTSIQSELLSKRGPLGSHRSVGVQADGSDLTTRDAKTLFQKLLPRISALSTKRKQASINDSGQSSSSDFSNSRSYFGSQSVQSCPERGCAAVEVQYAVSGNVKAILRTPSLPSKYSSRCSGVWPGDRLTPIIQGVSLSPPRTPPTNNSPKTSKAAPSRPGLARARL